MASPEGGIGVEVVYALPERQIVVETLVVAPATVRAAIEASGLLAAFPEIDLSRQRVGVFGRLRELDAAVEQGDRIEIYRPLVADPKEVRRRRAAQKQQGPRR
jgi:putative ubiquitin-RnfH superfamily antitoxin RatB of RatAB toxin-antitoxin module